MAKCGDFIKSQFPLIDEELMKYVEGMFSVGYKEKYYFLFVNYDYIVLKHVI